MRQRIRAAMLLRRLEDHAFGKVAMTPTQVSAALGVLKKAVPDLSSTALTNGDGGPLKIEVVRFADDQDSSA